VIPTTYTVENDAGETITASRNQEEAREAGEAIHQWAREAGIPGGFYLIPYTLH
jgi:hypothetical protein